MWVSDIQTRNVLFPCRSSRVWHLKFDFIAIVAILSLFFFRAQILWKMIQLQMPKYLNKKRHIISFLYPFQEITILS